MNSSNNNNPSIDPALNGSLAGTIQFAFSKLMQNINGMLPAQVVAYDRTNNRVQVQLLIAIVTTDGSQIPRAQIASIPVLILGGGGFMINFNLQPGDLGWVLANDRDISIFLQTYAQSPPNTGRTFSFSDGLFIPDIMRNYTIEAEDLNNFVIQSTNALERISFGTGQITITAPLVIINGALQVNGAFSANGGGNISGGVGAAFNVMGNITQTGDLAVTGNITATGDITPHV